MVTHSHPEGVGGAVAVALASALAWQLRKVPLVEYSARFFEELIRHVPDSEVKLVQRPVSSYLANLL